MIKNNNQFNIEYISYKKISKNLFKIILKNINVHKQHILLTTICIIYATSFLLLCLILPIYNENLQESFSPKKYTVCIDAGHGGIDGGAVGSFTKESDINLQIAKYLSKLFLAGNFKVYNTRTQDICLCDDIYSPRFKLDDMESRRKFIKECNPDILISIHCNKFSLSSCVGAQVFYQKGAVYSEVLANNITSYFVENLPNARKFTLAGDYYVLNSTSCPAILVECGYLSNIEEEKLLASEAYQQKIAYAIYAGSLKFLFSKW